MKPTRLNPCAANRGINRVRASAIIGAILFAAIPSHVLLADEADERSLKAAQAFRRFSLRGLPKVRTEWTLVMLAYNLKRLVHVGADLAAA